MATLFWRKWKGAKLFMDRFEELTKIWLDKAKDDLLWAKDSFDDEHFGGVCFLCQQSAEKALKSYLFFKKEKLVRTHHLVNLLKRCKKLDFNFTDLLPGVKVLNNYYTDTRYPDIWDVTRFEDEKLAKEALGLAKEVVEFVEKKVSVI